MAVEYRWYCLRAISGKELKVKELLEAQIKNGEFKGNVDIGAIGRMISEYVLE